MNEPYRRTFELRESMLPFIGPQALPLHVPTLRAALVPARRPNLRAHWAALPSISITGS